MSAQMTSPERLSVSARVWWREPFVWLVIGGPLAVVVAGVATAVIAVKNQDPVLDARNVGQSQYMTHARQVQSTKNHAQMANLQAAMIGRNHAASPLPLEPSQSK